MNEIDPTSLERLHDIIVPAPVPWWPPATGWWWLVGFGFAVLSALLLRSFARWQHNRYRREALARLKELEEPLADPAQRAAAMAEISALLKRAALTAYPREEVAGLTGAAWSSYLDRKTESSSFSEGPGVILHDAVCDPSTSASLDESTIREVLAAVRSWIRHHPSASSRSC
jgi:hypothetical protein